MHSSKWILVLAATGFLAACGGGGSGSGGGADPGGNEPAEVLGELKVRVGDKEGVFAEGEIPSTPDSMSPAITSAPDQVKTTASSSERVDLVYDVDSSIEEVYFSVNDEQGYYAFEKEQMASALDDSSTGTEAVSLVVEIPDTLDGSEFCASISVKSANQTLSDLTEVCFSVSDQNNSNRVIYFADSSSNSTLSTLNFDTGEVVDIGSTGYLLTDIAFYDDKLYGVTFTQLISLDLQTGQGEVVGDIGIDNVNGLEGGTDRLYAGTTDGEFIHIDPETGSGTVINFFGSGATSSGDLVFTESSEFLYGSLNVQDSETDGIARINAETGETEIFGNTGFDEVWGLAVFRSQLLGLTTNGELIIINRDTGEGTLIENTSSFNAGGAAAIQD